MDPYGQIKSNTRRFVRLDPNKSSQNTKKDENREEMGLQ